MALFYSNNYQFGKYVMLVSVFYINTIIADPITFSNGVYHGLTISIDPNVPADYCKDILTNLEVIQYFIFFDSLDFDW